MRLEAEAVTRSADLLSEDFDKAVATILKHSGKLIVSAVGKSGFIAKKIAATLTSTGTQADFLHPTEALHGDLAIHCPGDPAILISRSGSTDELLTLVPLLRHLGSPLIAIVGNGQSPLARRCDCVLEAFAEKEADPLALVPTSSAASALAVGDGLAAALMLARGFRPEQFARFHPGGQLGRNLLLRVADVLHPAERVAHLPPSAPISDVLIAMTEKPLGACCTVDGDGRLVGIVTDGDIRRMVRRSADLRAVRAEDVQSSNPRRIHPEQSLGEAIALMESGPSQVGVLPVVDGDGLLLGLIRVHDAVGHVGRHCHS
jgi:arabinose-5-phosphate isomerase